MAPAPEGPSFCVRRKPLISQVPISNGAAAGVIGGSHSLMQELDRFEGVVVMTTNLFGNYDEALLRRVQRHVEFRLPDASMRRELFALHLPNPERVKANLRFASGHLRCAPILADSRVAGV